MDPIKEAFQKIKQDILVLTQGILQIKQEIELIKQQNNLNFNQTNPTQNITDIPLLVDNPTHIPTNQYRIEPLKPLNLELSTRNRGVPTNQQTNKPTNQQTDNHIKTINFNNNLNDFEKVKEILDSLDSIKKEIRLKFKRLTNQEMMVFSTLYTLHDQGIKDITYKTIANNLSLSESSIRDYINRLINKGIPIIKRKQNNKTITLFVSSDLQKIASLRTIIKLREL